jgi:hypothetical protein
MRGPPGPDTRKVDLNCLPSRGSAIIADLSRYLEEAESQRWHNPFQVCWKEHGKMRTLLHLYSKGERLVLCAKVLQSPWHRLGR